MVKTPTVFPAAFFDPVTDAEALKAACRDAGTDEDAIFQILTKRTNEQRLEIAAHYKTMYGKELVDELKGELSGNFENVILALLTPPIDYQAQELHKAIEGLGTDETALVEILVIHDNDEIKAIAEKYEELYETSLEDDIIGDTSGSLRKLLVALSTGGRDETDEINHELAQQDAQDLYNAGENIWGTEESAFNAVLSQRSRPQLRLMFEKYEGITGHSFESALESEFSGSDLQALLALVHSIRDKIDYLVTRIHDSMAGLGTDDTGLIRIIVGRSEIDLGEIKERFWMKYGQTLGDWIEDDTSGDYKKCLLAML